MKIILNILFVLIGSISFAQSYEYLSSNSLEDIPLESVQLTKKDSSLIIYNSCDGGNGLIRYYKEDSQQKILLYGRQEDYYLNIVSSNNINDTTILTAVWVNSNDTTKMKMYWLNKEEGIWLFSWQNNVSSIYVDDAYSHEYKIVDQPCFECWEDECIIIEKQDSIRKKLLKNIKYVFEDYVEHEESTDSNEDKLTMVNSIKSITWVEDYSDYEILLNVWMYYDPTDFEGNEYIFKILSKNKNLSIQAISRRIRNKKDWENHDSAPYSDLFDLIRRLEKE